MRRLIQSVAGLAACPAVPGATAAGSRRFPALQMFPAGDVAADALVSELTAPSLAAEAPEQARFRLFDRVIAPFAPGAELTFLVLAALLCAFVTRALGAYYLVGAFAVAVTAGRLPAGIPGLTRRQLPRGGGKEGVPPPRGGSAAPAGVLHPEPGLAGARDVPLHAHLGHEVLHLALDPGECRGRRGEHDRAS